jgi:hypothetical protein
MPKAEGRSIVQMTIADLRSRRFHKRKCNVCIVIRGW